jgi:hypothetical protein
LRLANRKGHDVYIRPYAGRQNAGYILVDLDAADPTMIETMRAHGHAPCVVLATSPGRLQAWVRVSRGPLPPAEATAVARYLAQAYRADLASADWRHVGRLAGFTNQKPCRRQPNGLAPWVHVLYAQPVLAHDPALLARAASHVRTPVRAAVAPAPSFLVADSGHHPTSLPMASDEAVAMYQATMHQLRIPERFPQPDWSIVDKWIAKQLLSQGTPAGRIKAILRLGSPGFPRAHANPENYLDRTLARAVSEMQAFSARPTTTASSGHPVR